MHSHKETPTQDVLLCCQYKNIVVYVCKNHTLNTVGCKAYDFLRRVKRYQFPPVKIVNIFIHLAGVLCNIIVCLQCVLSDLLFYFLFRLFGKISMFRDSVHTSQLSSTDSTINATTLCLHVLAVPQDRAYVFACIQLVMGGKSVRSIASANTGHLIQKL